MVPSGARPAPNASSSACCTAPRWACAFTQSAQRDVERHEARRVDLEIAARHAEAFEERAHLDLERRVDGASAAPIDGDEHRVPATGPAARGGGPLHVGMPLRGLGVVGLGDGALLRPEGLRRVELAWRTGSGSTPPRAGSGCAPSRRGTRGTSAHSASAPTLPAAPLPSRWRTRKTLPAAGRRPRTPSPNRSRAGPPSSVSTTNSGAKRELARRSRRGTQSRPRHAA